jgi:pyruvate kinase
MSIPLIHEEGLLLRKAEQELQSLSRLMLQAVEERRSLIESLHPAQKASAKNLIRYLALRSRDIRGLQDALHALGLSSLASSESHILHQVQAVLRRLGADTPDKELSHGDHDNGQRLIHLHANKLFGHKRSQAIPHIMVTFDVLFLENPRLIQDLLLKGMNVARINSAHGGPEDWLNLIGMVRQASTETSIPCKIYMDLTGPRLRVTLRGRGRYSGRTLLKAGDEILFTESTARAPRNTIVVGCEEPGIVDQLRPGQRVLFDDGAHSSEVVSVSQGIARLLVTRVTGKRPTLRAEKGINFPDTDLEFPALTEQDLALLPFLAENVDLVGYSFVRDAAGFRQLQQEWLRFPKHPHNIIKIETPEALGNLPSLLLQGMVEEVYGVMIARGDLAVEVGFEKLSEVQEEILFLCEAAHAPVIWATQVLESQNKSGVATRAEVTDAAQSAMAECVMLNKGEHILEVLDSLRDILERSGIHHEKKRHAFMTMKIAQDFFGQGSYSRKADRDVLS